MPFSFLLSLIFAQVPALLLGVLPTAQALEAGCVSSFSRLIHQDPAWSNEFRRMQQGDLSAWKSWFGRSLVQGVGRDEFYAVTAAARALPREMATPLIREIAPRYTELAKRGAERFGPKRVADAVINALIRPESYFLEATGRGRHPDSALQIYFEVVRRVLSRSDPALPLDVHDVKLAAREFQNSLRKEQSARPGQRDLSVILFGSVVNGRGKPGKSDIDVILGKSTPLHAFGEAEGRIHQAIRSRYGQPLAPFERIPSELSDAKTMGVINPIQIRVTPDRVDVLVYPTHKAEDPARPLEPLVYRWF